MRVKFNCWQNLNNGGLYHNATNLNKNFFKSVFDTEILCVYYSNYEFLT